MQILNQIDSLRTSQLKEPNMTDESIVQFDPNGDKAEIIQRAGTLTRIRCLRKDAGQLISLLCVYWGWTIKTDIELTGRYSMIITVHPN